MASSVGTSASAALRTRILHHALPYVPEHSFTLQPLLRSLPDLAPDHADHDSSITPTVLDVLFGSELNARRELVGAWEQEGLKDMVESYSEASGSAGSSSKAKEMRTVAGLLARRLEYSARVGEHLVEASALLTAPGSAPSLPIPRRTLSILSTIVPALYRPPGSPLLMAAGRQGASMFSQLLETSNDRIPLFRMNPLGPLGYGWRIADAAWHHVERERGLQKGAAGEPVGAGPEWYIARVGLGLVYLSAESHLLQPPSTRAGAPASHLPKALRTLDTNLQRYEQIMSTIESGEQTAGDALGYLGFIGRAWAGIIRSRGW